MKWIFGLIFLSASMGAMAQNNPSCRFMYIDGVYTCELFNSAAVPPDVPPIQGSHDNDTLTDEMVKYLYTTTAGTTNYVLKKIFERFKNLAVLELRDTALEEIGSEYFFNCDQLEKIEFHDAILQSIPSNTFAQCSSLVEIDVSDGVINNLARDSFSGLSKLTTLRLNQNRLSSIPNNIFDSLTSLKVLDLSKNADLKTFANNVFRSNQNLEQLIISHNKFESLLYGYFEGLSNLKTLDARNSSVNSIQRAGFIKLTSLNKALFSSNTCIDKDFESYNYDAAKDDFEVCFVNKSSTKIVSKILLLLVVVYKLF